MVCLKSNFSGVSWVCARIPHPLGVPRPHSKSQCQRRELTADNHGVIVDPVIIVVHIGAAALVKELLIATVVGVTAPDGAEVSRQVWVADLCPFPQPPPAETVCFSP